MIYNQYTQSLLKYFFDLSRINIIKVCVLPVLLHLIGISIIFFLLLITPIAFANFDDDEGCLICHSYPRMTRVTEDGAVRSYYVIPEVYANTVHRNVPCRDCHTYIKELPHKPVKEGVTCNTECHSIKNPATGQPFSHKTIYDTYMQSIHGRNKIVDGVESDKPYCVTCHTNPLYDPNEETPPEHVVGRCVLCHESEKFVTQWYKHTSRRIRDVKRSPQRIVELCASCHDDPKLVKRHVEHAEKEGLEIGAKFSIAVKSYNDSFHGKLTNYGYENAANCLDCHVEQDNFYKSVHEIRPSRDPLSPVHKDNKVNTCKKCHIYADANYAQLDAHPTAMPGQGDFRHIAEQIYNIISVVTIIGLVGLSLIETFARRRDGAAFQLKGGTSWRRKIKSNVDIEKN